MSSERAVRALMLAVALLAPLAAQRDDGVTEFEAAQLAFPGCELQRRELALTPEQQDRVAKLSGVERAPASVVCYEARRDGVLKGRAFVDTRRVRTQSQTLLIAVDAEGKVARIEVLAFREPRHYLPRPEFFAQFLGKGLDDSTKLRRGIRPITGATMSARATADAVRTALAVDQLQSGRK
jgi:hypothetical protein